MLDRLARMSPAVSVLALLIGYGALGCATVPMASAEDDARMKRMSPPPDQGLVYLYRNEIFGSAVHMDVSMDGRLWGQTVANSFMVWQLRPGTHRLVSHTENDSEIEVDVLPGRRYFVWQEVKMGTMFARSRLQMVSEQQGQAAVNDCKLIKMPLPLPLPSGQEQSPSVASPPPAPTAPHPAVPTS
jgi:hypothetical protein